jgi:hypothetical protein
MNELFRRRCFVKLFHFARKSFDGKGRGYLPRYGLRLEHGTAPDTVVKKDQKREKNPTPFWMFCFDPQVSKKFLCTYVHMYVEVTNILLLDLLDLSLNEKQTPVKPA